MDYHPIVQSLLDARVVDAGAVRLPRAALAAAHTELVRLQDVDAREAVLVDLVTLGLELGADAAEHRHDARPALDTILRFVEWLDPDGAHDARTRAARAATGLDATLRAPRIDAPAAAGTFTVASRLPTGRHRP